MEVEDGVSEGDCVGLLILTQHAINYYENIFEEISLQGIFWRVRLTGVGLVLSIGDVVIGRGAGEGDCRALRRAAGKTGELACFQGGKLHRHVCSSHALAGRKRLPRHRDRIARFHRLESDGSAFGRASDAASDVDRVLGWLRTQNNGIAALARCDGVDAL